MGTPWDLRVFISFDLFRPDKKKHGITKVFTIQPDENANVSTKSCDNRGLDSSVSIVHVNFVVTLEEKFIYVSIITAIPKKIYIYGLICGSKLQSLVTHHVHDKIFISLWNDFMKLPAGFQNRWKQAAMFQIFVCVVLLPSYIPYT